MEREPIELKKIERSNRCQVASTFDDVLSVKIRDFMNRYTAIWPFSGTILIARQGKVFFEEGYELASQEYNVPNTPYTKHRLCSITKQFTAMAILILEERGQLTTMDLALQYLPDYPELDHRITIHHLLTHTSGLPYCFGTEFENRLESEKRILSQNEVHRFGTEMEDFELGSRYEALFRTYRTLPLVGEPGEVFEYSNFGYLLLACIIEQVSGMSYENFLEDNIFKPLKMSDTGVERDKKIIRNLATGYYLTGDELIRHKYVNLDHAIGAGDIYSTARDLVRWEEALKTEVLISKKQLEKMFTAYAKSGETTSESEDYGYGWFIDENHGYKRISHGGGGLGFLTEFHRYPDTGLSIIVLSNYGFTAVYKIAEILAAICFEQEYTFPSKPDAIQLDRTTFDEWCGIYQNDMETFYIMRKGDQCAFIIDGEYVIPMYPISPNCFHHMWIDEEYLFYRDDADNRWFMGAKKIEIE